MSPFLIGVCIFLLLILAFLFSWIHVSVKAENDSFEIKVRLWFIYKKFSFLDVEEEEERDEKQPDADTGGTQMEATKGITEKASNSEERKSSKTAKKEKKRFTFTGYESTRKYIELAGKILNRLLKAIKIESLNADVTVATDDAAKTAILYGEIMSFTGGLLATIQNMAELNKTNVNIQADFEKTRIIYFINARFKGKIYKLIAILVIFGYNYYKLNRKKAV